MKSSNKVGLDEANLRKILGQILLDSAIPLTNDIIKAITKPLLGVVSDYMIVIKKKFLEDMEFRTPLDASKLSGIPLTTIYTWISKGILSTYSIGSVIHVSMTQLQSIPYHPRISKSKKPSLKDTILPP